MLRPYNASYPSQQWRFIREAEDKGGLEGLYEIISLAVNNRRHSRHRCLHLTLFPNHRAEMH